MNCIFKSQAPYFNFDELNRLIHAVSKIDEKHTGLIEIDLSPYAYLGMHESLFLVLILRELTRLTPAKKILRLPKNLGAITFLERWNFFKEIKNNQEDYFLIGQGSITIGYDIPLDRALNEIVPLNRNEALVSAKLLEFTRINTFIDVTNYVARINPPGLLSVLMNQFNKTYQQAKDFASVIVLELLKNIIHHVFAFQKANPGGFNSKRIGFISMQTHNRATMERYGVDEFSKKWPPFVGDFIKNCNGVVEISVVDDGAGIGETISQYYKLHTGIAPESEIDLLRFCCKPGSSRFKANNRELFISEMEKIKAEIKALPDEEIPKLMDDFKHFFEKNTNNFSSSGWGLYLVQEKVKEWNGIMIIRSKNAYYLPFLPGYDGDYHLTTDSIFPGVQVQILLPM